MHLGVGVVVIVVVVVGDGGIAILLYLIWNGCMTMENPMFYLCDHFTEACLLAEEIW